MYVANSFSVREFIVNLEVMVFPYVAAITSFFVARTAFVASVTGECNRSYRLVIAMEMKYSQSSYT